MPGKSSGDLSQLMNAVVDDPDVKATVKALALDALNEARYQLQNGTPQNKANLIRALMPALISSLKETQTGDGLEALRETQSQIFSEMRDSK